ncbi:MAG: hypothetical protein M3Y27_31290 [Acidobacteriota bacterium]|nr:hypothetical protein [Acidobacteriota bacterium]
MHAISIHDRHEEGNFRWLAVDLIDILRLYEPEAAASSWQCRNFWCVPETCDPVRDDSDSGKHLSDPEMLRWAEGWQQVIDGEFVATREGESEPWLIILARDSSFYVVLAREDSTLEPVRKHFKDVQLAPYWAKQYA